MSGVNTDDALPSPHEALLQKVQALTNSLTAEESKGMRDDKAYTIYASNGEPVGAAGGVSRTPVSMILIAPAYKGAGTGSYATEYPPAPARKAVRAAKTKRLKPSPPPKAEAELKQPKQTTDRRNRNMTNTNALDMVEIKGLTSAIGAVSATMKVANVQLVGRGQVGGDLVTAMMRGSVSAAKATTGAGTAAVEEVGRLISAHVIPRPHAEVDHILPYAQGEMDNAQPMMLLTGEDIHRMSDQGARGPAVVNRDQIFTPRARDYLREHRVEVVYPQGEAAGERAPSAPAKYRAPFGAVPNEKPKHMTCLKGSVLIFKDHPRITFRGWIDALEVEILLTQQAAMGGGYGALAGELEEVLGPVRHCIRSDVLDEPVGATELCGYTPEQLREHSHHPEKHFGQPHFLIYHIGGPALPMVNKLCTVMRQTEPATYAVSHDAGGNVARGDVILGLNRLLSLMWVFTIKLKAGRYKRK